MRWPSIKSRKFASALIVACLTSPVALPLDEKRLWLPVKYHGLFLDLKKAALTAESLDSCVTVLRGTIDLDQSQKAKPVYRILCRRANGKSYNQMIDGVTLEPIVPPPTVEELEAQRLAIEGRWLSCEDSLKQKTRLMQGVTWISALPPEPRHYGEGATNFTVDFDAQNTRGVPLKYRAMCQFLSDGSFSLKISPRKEN